MLHFSSDSNDTAVWSRRVSFRLKKRNKGTQTLSSQCLHVRLFMFSVNILGKIILLLGIHFYSWAAPSTVDVKPPVQWIIAFIVWHISRPIINVNNDNSAEIKKRILMANKGFYGLKRQFRSQFLSIKNKIKLYKTLIRPVLAYGSETWVVSKSDEAILGVFERKILRAVFGPTNDNGEWRIKYNNEWYTLYSNVH